MRKSRVISIAMGGVLLFLSVFISIQIIGPIIQSSMKYRNEELASRIPFDEIAWRSAGDSRAANPKRTQMIDDLLKTTDFHGMTKGEVIAQLGKASETDKFRGWNLVYWLGDERSYFPIDSEWLVFRLNAESRVTDYRIVND